jgi:hypothetical protein
MKIIGDIAGELTGDIARRHRRRQHSKHIIQL